MQAHGGADFLTQATCPHISNDCRRPHIDLKTQQRIADDVWQNLRNRAVADLVEPCSASRLDPFQRAHIDVLIHFGIEFAQRSGGVQANRQHPGHRPNRKTKDKDQSPDQVRDGAGDLQPTSAEHQNPFVRGQIARRRKGQKEGPNNPQSRSHKGNQNGFDPQIGPCFPPPKPICEILAQRRPMQLRKGFGNVFAQPWQARRDDPTPFTRSVRHGHLCDLKEIPKPRRKAKQDHKNTGANQPGHPTAAAQIGIVFFKFGDCM